MRRREQRYCVWTSLSLVCGNNIPIPAFGLVGIYGFLFWMPIDIPVAH